MNPVSGVIDLFSRAARLPAERRRQKRIPMHIPLRIYVSGAVAGGYHAGSCSNISESGLAFETADALDLSSQIEIEFYQAGQPVVRRAARLLYRAGRQYGAYFTDRSPETS